MTGTEETLHQQIGNYKRAIKQALNQIELAQRSPNFSAEHLEHAHELLEEMLSERAHKLHLPDIRRQA